MTNRDRLAVAALLLLVFALFALLYLVALDAIGVCGVLAECDESAQITPEAGECLTVYYMRGPVLLGRAQVCN